MGQVYKSPLWLRYAIPFAAIGLMILARIAIIDWMEGRYPLILFVLPVILATWFGGLGPGITAAVLGLVAGVMLPKPYNLELSSAIGHERLVLYGVVASFSILMVTKLHNALNRAENNESSLQKEILERKIVENNLRQEVSERLKAEAALADALEKAEMANRAKTDFLANMSHEIRTPMNAVVGLTSILSMAPASTAKQKEIISTLKISADSLLTLIDDMLDITKIEARSIELEVIPFDLAKVAEDVITIMGLRAKEKGIELNLKMTDDPPNGFVGDPTRVRQVMMNLCSNAVKFTDSGVVSLEIKAVPISEKMATVVIGVRDTGIGIAPGKIATIFEKFVQADSSINRKYGGSGLGLAITKNLCEIMGGEISIESALGQGSVFTVQLPMLLSAPSVRRKPEAEVKRPTSSTASSLLKVLLVEDNAANIMVAGAFLEQFGFTFDVATNGFEAVAKVSESPYCAVLMDVQMPGMNGLDATRAIRKKEGADQTRLHIIGMTAHAMGGDREMCLAAGMNDYIAKPFDPEQLRTKLKAAC